MPAGVNPHPEAISLLGDYLEPGDTVAMATTSHAEKYVALVIGRQGSLGLWRKSRFETRPGSRCGMLHGHVHLWPAPPPSCLGTQATHEAPGILQYDVIRWRPRWRAWALADKGRRGSRLLLPGSAFRGGFLGRDLAPWNLLATEAGWALIDWEDRSPRSLL